MKLPFTPLCIYNSPLEMNLGIWVYILPFHWLLNLKYIAPIFYYVISSGRIFPKWLRLDSLHKFQSPMKTARPN